MNQILYSEKSTNSSTKKRIIVLAVLLVVICSTFFIISNLLKDKILANVYVGDVNIGMQTKEEAKNMILSQIQNLENYTIILCLDEKNIELLNSVYKDINDEFGIDVAMRMYQLYKGTQVNFPMRFLNPELVKRKILEEFDGTNLKQLAVKYSYSEKTLRRLIKDSIK